MQECTALQQYKLYSTNIAQNYLLSTHTPKKTDLALKCIVDVGEFALMATAAVV